MKKYYDLADGTWVWDTDSGKWTPPIKKHKQNAPKRTETPQDSTKLPTTWLGTLYTIFVECRAFPGWNDIYSFYGEEDRNYFMRLEKFYEEGKLKVDSPSITAV